MVLATAENPESGGRRYATPVLKAKRWACRANPAAAVDVCARHYWLGEGDRRQSRLLGKDLLGMKADEWREARSYPDDFP